MPQPHSRVLGEQRRAEILAYVKEYQAEHGWPPTAEEIAQHLDVTRSAISHHFKTLQQEGKIVRGVGTRAYRIVEDP